MTADQIDHAALLGVIVRIGRAESIDAFARSVCVEIFHLVPSLWVSYNETNLSSGRSVWFRWPERPTETESALLPVFTALVHQNPLVRHTADHPQSGVTTLAEIDPGGEFFETELFRQYYGPSRMQTQAAFALPSTAGVVTAVAINNDATGFSPSTLRWLDMLREHLTQIHRGILATEEVDRLATQTRIGGWESVLIDDAGAVVQSDGKAIAMGLEFGLDLHEGATIVGTELWDEVELLRGGPGFSVSRRSTVLLASTTSSITATVTIQPVGPHVLMLRADAATVETTMSLGLTRRQAEVALLLVEGATNQQVARRLGISEGTARKHVENILLSLNLPSRAAVATAVMRSGSAHG